MSLEESLERLAQVLDKQDNSNQAVMVHLEQLIQELHRDQNNQAQNFDALLNNFGVSAHHSDNTLQELAAQAHKLDEASRTFTTAATRTQQSASELAQLIKLLEFQTQQQSLSIKFQNESIATTLRIAKANSRSGWVQNWLFFFLGILIPIVIQLAFKFF